MCPMFEDDQLGDSEVCANCVYWESRGRGWGRCWAPESDGERLGVQVVTDGNAFLSTAEDFGCSAWAPVEDLEDREWTEDY